MRCGQFADDLECVSLRLIYAEVIASAIIFRIEFT
ncbi:MAG: hypothetical protein ACI915_005121, partial [Gammaproteobacteria bacterium]